MKFPVCLKPSTVWDFELWNFNLGRCCYIEMSDLIVNPGESAPSITSQIKCWFCSMVSHLFRLGELREDN